MAKEENVESKVNHVNHVKRVEKSFRQLAREYFRCYCERSTIHCVRYLYDPRLHNIERIIWSVLLVISVTLCCSFYMLLSERYGDKKLQTVIEDPQYPVFHVQFPAVGVCTDNRINWSKLEAAKAEFLPANSSQELIKVFTALVGYLETLRFDNFKYSNSELEDCNLEAVDFVNITTLANFLSLRCQDILDPGSCRWRHAYFNCCDYFVTEKTEYGLCLVFNSILSEKSQKIRKSEGNAYYPKHNAKAGQSTGLNFNLLLHDRFKRPQSKATDNVYIMIKKPDQLSNVVYSITPNTETHVTIRPQMTSTDRNTRNIPAERRNCHFTDEHQDFGTSDAPRRFSQRFLLLNCLNNCHESYLVKLCNCTLPIFFLINQKGEIPILNVLMTGCFIFNASSFYISVMIIFISEFLLTLTSPVSAYDTAMTSFLCQLSVLFFQSWTALPLACAVFRVTMASLNLVLSVGQKASINVYPQDIFSYDKHLKEDDYFSAAKPGMTCPCLVSCNVLEYYTSTTTLPLSGHIRRPPSQKFFKLDVHYQVENMMTFRTSIEFSSIDLIANLGGIFGLCLGASMVSAVELVYYLTVGFGLHLYDNEYYGRLLEQLSRKWAKWKRYFRNEISHAHREAALADAIAKSKLRHPFNNRPNAW